MRFLVGLLLVSVSGWHLSNVLIIGSSIAVPLDYQVQEYVAGGCGYEGYGPAMDVVHFVVCAVYIRTAVGVQLPFGE